MISEDYWEQRFQSLLGHHEDTFTLNEAGGTAGCSEEERPALTYIFKGSHWRLCAINRE